MLNISIKEARKSPFEHYKLGAAIVKSGRLLSTGYNELRYTNSIPTKREYPHSLHAEASAISKLLKKDETENLKGSTIFVSRVTAGGNLAISKPCNECMCLILEVGIKKIVYTTNHGIETLKL